MLVHVHVFDVRLCMNASNVISDTVCILLHKKNSKAQFRLTRIEAEFALTHFYQWCAEANFDILLILIHLHTCTTLHILEKVNFDS